MSAKASTQPGRRTPLSLSGTVSKTNPIKGGNNAANGGGNNTNGHTSSNTNKQDNKMLQQQKNELQIAINSDVKENPKQKQQPQADKKQQQNDNKKSNEKDQNGVNNNKHQQSTENKQQQQNKEKQSQQNGNDDNKVSEKDKKEKSEKPDKLDKQQDKPEKEVTKSKENKKVEQDKSDNKKEERKSKEVKDAKEDKKEAATKSDAKTEQQQQVKNDDKKLKEEKQVINSDQQPVEKIEKMEVVQDHQTQQKSASVTPKMTPKAHKPSTPVNKTPTKQSEKTPEKLKPTTPVTKREVTTTIDDDIEMEPLAIESSPIKSSQPEQVTNINLAPSATSTPGKILLSKRNSGVPKSDVYLSMQTGLSPERPRSFSQISGRKSIRQISDYTPSKFQSNLQFRESYRRINTELDVTNTSMNVTVGSEVPNNLSFSFFGRGRKRDRTSPPHSQSAIGELKTDGVISPPKRARLDMHGFFSVVSSPLSLLRNRFSKASLQSSTPVKLQCNLNAAEDEIEVQNVSGVSVHEEIAKSNKEPDENNSTVNDDYDTTLGEEAKENKLKIDVVTPMAVNANSEGKEIKDVSFKCEKTCGIGQTCEQIDIKITETPLQPAVEDPMAKNKRCTVM